MFSWCVKAYAAARFAQSVLSGLSGERRGCAAVSLSRRRRNVVRFWGTQSCWFDMSYGQYSWLITIKDGASHPMVPLGIYTNHYFWILTMDGMTINHIVSIDHGSYGNPVVSLEKKLYVLMVPNDIISDHY